jgi:phosphoribosylformimino-5-aminoimidazole carboxamide ribotide isomerase
MDILPAIDLRSGKCVRLLQGQYDKQIDYADDPLPVAQQFEQAGARWLHVVDLDGAKEGRPCNLPTIQRIIENTGLQVEVGGGLREKKDIQTLIDAGAARCVVGTRALEDWDWFADLVQDSACQNRVALGLDAKSGKLATRGWLTETDVTPADLAVRASSLPIAAIIYTDISKDGMMSGPNAEATHALARATDIPVIASGGVTTLDDVRTLAALPLGGMIIGRAIYEGQIDVATAIAIAAGEQS